VVEVLSDHDLTNPGEFQEKLWEYLSAGVALIWVLSPRHDTVTVYDQAGGLAAPSVLARRRGDHLDGGGVLPGFSVPLASLFRPPPSARATPQRAQPHHPGTPEAPELEPD
jgi:Putative restriction endonuclease